MNKKHHTTKNTGEKPVIVRFRIIGVECNGRFDLVTDFLTQKEFDDLFYEWYNHPSTFMWCAQSLITYIKIKQPKRICLLKEDYEKWVEGKGVLPATKEEWESENN